MLSMIDTHAHLYLEDFKHDLDQIIQNAVREGVSKIFMPNIDSKSYQGMMDVAGKYPDICYPLIGLHPCSVNESFKSELSFIEKCLESEPFFGIGETGTDLYWDKTYINEQKEALIRQIGLAGDYQLPVILHSRNSLEETISMVATFGKGKITGIFHCFNGDPDQAKRIIDCGFFLGIGGVITFKNSHLDKIVKEVDLKNIVLETDSPYLAPVPYRGKRNEPSRLTVIVNKIAEVKGIPPEEVARITTFNSMQIFKSAI